MFACCNADGNAANLLYFWMRMREFCAKKNAKQREKRKVDSDYIKLSRISQKNRGKSIDLGAGSW